MKICCLSDLHGHYHYPELEEYINKSDVVVIAGDFSETYFSNNRSKIRWERTYSRFENDTLEFLKSIRRPIVLVAGNHDYLLDRGKNPNAYYYEQLLKEIPDLHYLNNSAVEVERKIFFGNPWTPFFLDWAFNYSPNEVEHEEQFNRGFLGCPDEVDVIVSHGPPKGILDETVDFQNVGCPYLRKVLDERKYKNLKAVVFGHIHHSYGDRELDGVKFVNASICTENYDPINIPILIDI